MTTPLCWINGKPGSLVSVSDRALQYGDGLFETIRIRRARPEFLDRHLKRLVAGCERLKFPPVDRASLGEEIVTLAAQTRDGVLKVILSRGNGNRGYRIQPDMAVTRILSIHPLPEWPIDQAARGIRTRLCSTRLATQPALAGIKHLNRLEQVLARAEWDDPAIAEGLMMDRHNRLIEGTMSNVFIVKDGVVKTPDLSDCGVAGIMRSVILDRAKPLAEAVSVQPLQLGDVETAQEVFVCNCLIGIWPVVSIDDVGVFEVGQLTRQLQGLLNDDTPEQEGCWYSS